MLGKFAHYICTSRPETLALVLVRVLVLEQLNDLRYSAIDLVVKYAWKMDSKYYCQLVFKLCLLSLTMIC